MVRKPAGGRQLNLFEGPHSPTAPGEVGPAQVPQELEELARRLPDTIRLGTSSWSFPGWQGLVYDGRPTKAKLARKGLAAYARHPLLRTVGIDRTYYAPLPASAFEEYAEAVPDDFRFLVKAAGSCTDPVGRDAAGRPAGDNERFLHPTFAVDEIVGPFSEGLGPKAGPLVFQFPPLGPAQVSQPARFAERLGRFLSALPRGSLYAVELRDRELLGPDYFAALASGGATHCFNVHPRMPTVEEQRRLAGPAQDGTLVVRWMLHAGLGYEQAVERYEPFARLVDEDRSTRASLADLCLDRALRGQQVVLVANNKAEGSAPLTVFRLAERIARQLSEGAKR